MTVAGARAACFDPAAMQALRSILTEPEVDQLLSAFLHELETRPALIATLIEQGDYRGARSEAHRFKGGSLYFGSVAVTEIAERIEMSPDAVLPMLAMQFVGSAGRMFEAIRKETRAPSGDGTRR